MEDKKFIILSMEAYENLLNYLGSTQTYNNVAKLISDTVQEAAQNSKVFRVEPNLQGIEVPKANPEAGKLSVVKDEQVEEVDAE